MTRHHGALLALWLALPARAAVVEVKVLAMPVAGAARHAPPAVAPPSLLLAPSALAPVPLPASRGEGILAKLGLRAPRGIDVQLDLLFDGSLPQASGLWEPSAELAKADTEVQGLSPELARDLVQVSRLPEDRQRLVVRQLSGTPIRVRGPPAFSDDHTFSLEIEFQVSRQLAGPGPLPGRLWERARRAVALRALEAAPAGWRLKGDPRGASNTLELNTGGANGAFHVNTPAEWAELVAGLERLDLALPGGLYGLHIHNGLASRRADHGLDVDDDRFARLTKVYEAYWRALSGLGYRAPREPVTGQRGQIDYLPLEALIPGRGGLYARDHGVAINLHPDFPTIETRILSGLLERDPAGAERLNAERLAADVWWSFALARAAAGEDHFELATLGVPVTAGMRPSLKQILHFADRVYREDATGKALAIQKLLERYGEDEGLPDDRLAEEDARIRALYRRLGLGTVYELHSGHDGIDENLLEHLRSPGRFSALVRDLSLAHAEDASALALFPASLRPELARALRQERREEPLWRRALGAVKRAF